MWSIYSIIKMIQALWNNLKVYLYTIHNFTIHILFYYNIILTEFFTNPDID